MPRYFVKVTRHAFLTRTVEMEAASEEEAHHLCQFDELATAQRAPWLTEEDVDGDDMDVIEPCSPTCRGWVLDAGLVQRCDDCARFKHDGEAVDHVLGTGDARFVLVLAETGRVLDAYPGDGLVRYAQANKCRDLKRRENEPVRYVLAVTPEEWELALQTRHVALTKDELKGGAS